MDVRTLDSVPSLGPLYAKAAAGFLPGGRGSEPPAYALEVEEVAIDPDAVAAYARVCGFDLGEALPPTYPHLLGFPLSMALMTDRSFPFRLMGLVHIANRIDQRAPVAIGSAPAVRVSAEDMRPHRRGRQIDLVTEVRVRGELAWTERSTYLRMGGGDGDGEKPRAEPDPLEGVEPSAFWEVPGDIGRRYAAVSGDRNPIHLHSISARAFGFPSAIAHGMWTYAKALASLAGHHPPEHSSEVEFRAPLRIPGRAELLSAGRDGGWDVALDSPGGERRHLLMRVEPL